MNLDFKKTRCILKNKSRFQNTKQRIAKPKSRFQNTLGCRVNIFYKSKCRFENAKQCIQNTNLVFKTQIRFARRNRWNECNAFVFGNTYLDCSKSYMCFLKPKEIFIENTNA